MRRRVIALCLGLLVTGIAGCTIPAPRPPEYLDPDTAALVTTVNSPIIFARNHNDVAANARQYATVADLATALYLSPGTVRNHLSSVMQKLDARNRAEAIQVAERRGWL